MWNLKSHPKELSRGRKVLTTRVYDYFIYFSILTFCQLISCFASRILLEFVERFQIA